MAQVIQLLENSVWDARTREDPLIKVTYIVVILHTKWKIGGAYYSVVTARPTDQPTDRTPALEPPGRKNCVK